MLENLKALLSKHSIELDVEFNTTKVIRNGAQWGIGEHSVFGGKDIYRFHFGDFSRDIEETWFSWDKDAVFTSEEKKILDKKAKENSEAIGKHKEKVQLEVAQDVSAIFDTLEISGTPHPYLTKKQIPHLFGARNSKTDSGDVLVVPMRDVKGVLWNIQRIYAQKLSSGTDKFFYTGAKVTECFHILQGELTNESTVYICEGFATAASVALALGEEAIVIAAFNANNLQPVATSIKEAYPSIKIVMCADNDAFTSINGKPVNVGLEKARRAAGAVGGSVVYPIFKGIRYEKGS